MNAYRGRYDKKEVVREKIEQIKYLSRTQDSLFYEATLISGVRDENLKDWLFDAAFNDGDFDFIWDEKIKK